MKMKTTLQITLALTLAVGLGGEARGATTNVHFGSFYFSPSVVHINVGDTVQWVYDDGFSHTVTGTGSEPLCGSVGTSGCFKTFLAAGSYPYVCVPHGGFGMTGLVVVASAPVPATPAVLTNMMVLPEGYSQFKVISTAQRTNLVQASTNLGASNWTTISTVVPATNSFVVTDSNAPAFELRFYRVVQP